MLHLSNMGMADLSVQYSTAVRYIEQKFGRKLDLAKLTCLLPQVSIDKLVTLKCNQGLHKSILRNITH